MTLAVLAALSFSADVHAENEAVRARIYWNSVDKNWPTPEAALEAQRVALCGGMKDCHAELLDEIWWSNSSWYHRFSYGYTVVNPGYEDQVVKDLKSNLLIVQECPPGWQLSGWMTTPKPICIRPKPIEGPCFTCPSNEPPVTVGNPIAVATGAKVQVDQDYRNASGSLSFARTYGSNSNTWKHSASSTLIDFSRPIPKPLYPSCFVGWSGFDQQWVCFEYWYYETPDLQLRRANKPAISFHAGSLLARSDINERLSPWVEAGSQIGWLATNTGAHTVEAYDFSGLLRKSTTVNGQVTTYVYSDEFTPANVAPKPGLLIQIVDHFGSQLNFTYNASGQMATMVDPANQTYQYSYDVTGNLERVTYPGGTSKTYVYGELDKTAGISRPRALTGIIDENGKRYATFTYNDEGKAASTEHAGGVEKYEVSYIYDYIRKVKDPLGTVRQYNFAINLGANRNTSVTQPGPGGVGTVSSTVKYGDNANVESRTNTEGVTTTFSYNLARNLEISRTEAVGTADARTITTAWHPTLRLRAAVAEPKRITRYTFDGAGNVESVTVQATNDANGSQGFSAAPVGKSRKSTYEYNAHGQLLVENGPRDDIADTTRYTYDPATGNLASVTNPLNQVTYFSGYDAHGRVGHIQAPDGVVTEMSYTPRGWLQSRTVRAGGASRTTSYSYDDAGNMTKVIMPDGATLTYTYDDAHRLTDITDNLGNSIRYTLDAMGNRTLEKTHDLTGQLARQVAREFDALNLLKKQTGAAL